MNNTVPCMKKDENHFVLAKRTGMDQYLLSGHYVFRDEAEAYKALKDHNDAYDTVVEIPTEYLELL